LPQRRKVNKYSDVTDRTATVFDKP